MFISLLDFFWHHHHQDWFTTVANSVGTNEPDGQKAQQFSQVINCILNSTCI
jgi:hypothetical protein